MHTRLKPAEIRWLTPTVGTLPSGLQTTLLLTAGLALRVGRQRGAAEERQSCVNTDTPILRENKLPAGRAVSGQNLNSAPVGLTAFFRLFTAAEQKSF